MNDKQNTIKTKVLIIGSGPAGLTAAIYAARANLEPVLVTGMSPGGQLTTTADVENYPGFVEPIGGPQLMQQMTDQAKRVGTNVINDHINRVEELKKPPFICFGESNDKYVCDSLIIATGAEAKWLGVSSEQKFRGFGVSACATCDGFFYKGKSVAVIGGGSVAVEDALFLSNFAKDVTVIHRRDQLRAEKVLQDKLFANEKIKVIWDHVLDEVLGNGNPLSVTGLRIKSVKDQITQELTVDGVFIAIGHAPSTTLFKGMIEMDEGGYIITASRSAKTSVEGVFAAGDVQDKDYRQAVTSAGSGCMAAIEVERYLSVI